MPVRILVTGDIHIGRRPTRVPEPELAERASAARMWEAIVSLAIALRVDGVMLAKKLHADKSLEINDICQTLRLSRSTFYRYVRL
jgi:hypothetical protein